MFAEYKKETDKSYMILEAGQEEDVFSVQMLSENKLSGLVDFEKRSFNGEKYFFYDITGKHSLNSQAEKKLLQEKEIRKLLQSFYCTVGELHRHFLDIGGLLAEAEYIYAEEKEFYFCYYPPGENVSVQETQELLAEQLLELTDHEDEGAVELIYQFYKMVKESEKGIMQILEETLTQESPVTEVETEEEKYVFYEEQEEPETKVIFKDKPTIIIFFIALLVSLGYLGTGVFPGTPKTARDLAAYIFLFLSLFGIAMGFVDIGRKK